MPTPVLYALHMNRLDALFPSKDSSALSDNSSSETYRIIADQWLTPKEGGKSKERLVVLEEEYGGEVRRYAALFPFQDLMLLDTVTFIRAGQKEQIKTSFLPAMKGIVSLGNLHYKNKHGAWEMKPVRDRVVYEKHDDGVWRPVEYDGHLISW